MTTLEEAAALARHDRGLVVISTMRSNGTIQASACQCRCDRSPNHGRDCPGTGHRWPDQTGQPPRPSPGDGNLPQRLAVGGGRGARRACRAR